MRVGARVEQRETLTGGLPAWTTSILEGRCTHRAPPGDPEGLTRSCLETWALHSTPERVARAARPGHAPSRQPRPSRALLYGQKRGQIRPERLFPPTVSLLHLLPTVTASPSSAPVPSNSSPSLSCTVTGTPPMGQPPAQSLPGSTVQAPQLALPSPLSCSLLQLLAAARLRVHLPQAGARLPLCAGPHP